MAQRRHSKKFEPMMSRAEKDRVSEETKGYINVRLTDLIDNPDLKEISFPTTLSNLERKFAHMLARKYGLNSKSKGIEPNRFITVYKRPLQTKDLLTITQESRHLIERLLASPTTEDGQELEAAHQSSEMIKRSQLTLGKLLLPRTNLNLTKTFREKLPISSYQNEILKSIQDSSITIIVGETGSGKTTQVPQIIMESSEIQNKKCQIICSMPRRVAAVTISERVAFERGEVLGGTVGYQIRLDAKVSSKTILTYCTNGVLLRSLLFGFGWLNNVSHIILDEVHERDKLTDFILIVLKSALAKYRNLKLIVMSATIDIEKFRNYFRDCPFDGDDCTIVQVPGKMYEVKEVYLEHILEGCGYMSPEMRSLSEEIGVTHTSGSLDCPSQRVTETEVEKPIYWLNPELKIELDLLLDTVLNNGSPETLKTLIHFMHLKKIHVDYQHHVCGRTALMAAVMLGDIDAIESLIHMDPDLAVTSREGKTAVMYAEEAGDVDILELFENYTSYFEEKRPASDPPEEFGITPAMQQLVYLYEKCHIGKEIDEHLVVHLLKLINADAREGAVLVFLPGYEHIMCVRDSILQNKNEFQCRPLDVHMLHSRIKPADQKKVFDPPPAGHRKVILSTNIAETSVTINDVSFVIDCGKVKEQNYNTLNGTYKLECDWISQSCAQQRKGRAGRTQEGVCFRLYTSKRYQSFKNFKIPELLREPIADLCLQAKQLAPTGMSIAEFLGRAIDPPPTDITKNTITLLKKMGALTENEDLTPLANHLLKIPLDPQFGKMIVYSILLKCLDPVLTIVCCISCGEMFKLPTDREARVKLAKLREDLSDCTFSDHFVYLKAFREWEAAAKMGREWRWCQDNFVSPGAMEMIAGVKQQILNLLRVNPSANKNSCDWTVVKAAIAAGLYPNIARVDQKRNCLRTRNAIKAVIQNASVLRNENGRGKLSLPTDYLLFEESHQIGMLSTVRTCTVVSPITLCLFSGTSQTLLTEMQAETSDHEQDLPNIESSALPKVACIQIDEFIQFHAEYHTATSIHALREKLDSLVSRSMNSQRLEINEDFLDVVVTVLKTDDVPALMSNPMEYDIGNTFSRSHKLPFSFRGRGRVVQPYNSIPDKNWREEGSPLRSGNTFRPRNPKQPFPPRGRGRGVQRFTSSPNTNWRVEGSPFRTGNYYNAPSEIQSSTTRVKRKGLQHHYTYNRDHDQSWGDQGFLPSRANAQSKMRPFIPRVIGRGQQQHLKYNRDPDQSWGEQGLLSSRGELYHLGDSHRAGRNQPQRPRGGRRGQANFHPPGNLPGPKGHCKQPFQFGAEGESTSPIYLAEKIGKMKIAKKPTKEKKTREEDER